MLPYHPNGARGRGCRSGSQRPVISTRRIEPSTLSCGADHYADSSFCRWAFWSRPAPASSSPSPCNYPACAEVEDAAGRVEKVGREAGKQVAHSSGGVRPAAAAAAATAVTLARRLEKQMRQVGKRVGNYSLDGDALQTVSGLPSGRGRQGTRRPGDDARPARRRHDRQGFRAPPRRTSTRSSSPPPTAPPAFSKNPPPTSKPTPARCRRG